MSGVATLVLCFKCKTEKPASDFRRCAAKKNGLGSYCRSCANAAHNVWVREHAALISQRSKTYMRRYKEKNPATYPPTVHQRLAACEGLLREMEWGGLAFDAGRKFHVCLSCGGYREVGGHSATCRIAALLAVGD